MQLSKAIFLMVILWSAFSTGSRAQDTLVVNLPDINIFAGKVTRGDADVYGLGDWHCKFEVEVMGGAKLLLKGTISFWEKANDYTTIIGKYEQVLSLKALEPYAYHRLQLLSPFGKVGGPNIGARGFRWFEGEGIIQKAYIQTDTFGEDAGRIGGTVRFHPIVIIAQREYAVLEGPN